MSTSSATPRGYVSDAERERRFTYRPPKGDQPERYNRITAECLRLAKLIRELVARHGGIRTVRTHPATFFDWRTGGPAARRGVGRTRSSARTAGRARSRRRRRG